ncbi:maleylpyruvate isomerase family mycothiol-dependent enzyme [Nonomuraea muscovyensis]|uniref:maleylpyruvate isomerase family mycothiol-dependent enzyme n=1 Tax=Nonomuraea muscovyensis TaxID=1124761 RepID=UPI0033C24FFB
MNRDEIWLAIDHERSTLADLLDDLSDQEWEVASLCSGWRVRDVAAHLTLAHMGVAQAARELLKVRGDINCMLHDTAVRQAELPVHQISALLRGMVGSRRKAPGGQPLLDILVHGQDIAIPLGRDRPMPVRAAAFSATRIWTMKWPFTMGWSFHARQELTGLEFAATDHAWSVGQGQRVEGSIAAILLLLNGRRAALTRLSGPGMTELRARLPLATQI